jgi:glycosyltransferase involved in cell wall biosynthesis
MSIPPGGGYSSSAHPSQVHVPAGRLSSLSPTPARSSQTDASSGALAVAVLAPPWITVPPDGYGGIEWVVGLLCDELVARGHDVTLFAAPGSRSRARISSPLPTPYPRTIGSALHESDHVAIALDEIDAAAARGHAFDVIHDHSGFIALGMAARVRTPVVHTVHGPVTGDMALFYERHGHKALLVAINRSQFPAPRDGARPRCVVPNPIVVEDWPLRVQKDDFLLWVGRMDPTKGAHRAIAVARDCERPLLLAGPVQPGQDDYFREDVEPHVDGDKVSFLGEVGGARRKQLFARARAFLMPIRWPEPFGMVMVEALACGTPVLAFPEGAASEIVIEGVNGFLVRDEREMVRAVARLDTIDPRRCRESVAERYDVAVVTDGYEDAYRHAIQSARKPAPLRFPEGQRAAGTGQDELELDHRAIAVAGG